MKDLGIVDFIIEINITKTFDRLVSSQSHYVEKVLKKCFKDDNSIVKILMDKVFICSKIKARY